MQLNFEIYCLNIIKQERSVLKVKSFSDEELGGSAREAKRRLDEKFTASMKPEKNKSYLWFIAQLKP